MSREAGRSSDDRVYVCESGELPAGDHLLTEVDGAQVGVFNVDGEYYAIENKCAHQGGPVCQGDVRPELVGEFVEPGERVEESHGDRLVIACPQRFRVGGRDLRREIRVFLDVPVVPFRTELIGVAVGSWVDDLTEVLPG